MFGPPKEIEEVKIAKAAYARLEKIDLYTLKDLLKVYGLMVGGLTAQAGRFRTVEVGVYSGERKKLVHAGTPHKLVPGMNRELLSRGRNAGVHSLISSCVGRSPDAREATIRDKWSPGWSLERFIGSLRMA